MLLLNITSSAKEEENFNFFLDCKKNIFFKMTVMSHILMYSTLALFFFFFKVTGKIETLNLKGF